MEENNEYLNEERYQRSKRRIIALSLLILIIGLFLGGTIIYKGINKYKETDSKYSENSRENIINQLALEKQKLESRITELKEQGIEYDPFTKYTDGEKYELKVITNVLDPSFEYYEFDEYKENPTTARYCALKSELKDFDKGFNKSFETHKAIPYFMIGGFIVIAALMFSVSIYSIAKRREIMAFAAQQVMPVAQEGMEKMAPTLGKVTDEIAPSVRNMAKEIAKGIKDGLEEDKK